MYRLARVRIYIYARIEVHRFVSDVPDMSDLEKVESSMVDEKSRLLDVKKKNLKSVVPTILG